MGYELRGFLMTRAEIMPVGNGGGSARDGSSRGSFLYTHDIY